MSSPELKIKPKINDFLKNIIYLFLERREGGKKERERNINVWFPLMHPLLRTWPTTLWFTGGYSVH